MINYRYVRGASPSHTPRTGRFWCNICNEPCASNEALRAHYRERHPEAAANLEPQSGASPMADQAKT